MMMYVMMMMMMMMTMMMIVMMRMHASNRFKQVQASLSKFKQTR